MKHLETSIPGLACLCAGLILFLYGTHSTESVVAAGGCVAAGIGLLKAADASKVNKGSGDAEYPSK